MNEQRVTRYLANDPRFDIVRQIITEGGHIDTPPDFVRTRRTAPFRHMQTHLPPVYYKAVAEMHDKHKVLLFRLSDLTPEELQNPHCANEYHWRPEPGKVAGRPLLACSNAPPGAIQLNSEYTRSFVPAHNPTNGLQAGRRHAYAHAHLRLRGLGHTYDLERSGRCNEPHREPPYPLSRGCASINIASQCY